jgi:hypothetical protein
MRSNTPNEEITAERIAALDQRTRALQTQYKRAADASQRALQQREAAAPKHPPAWWGSPEWRAEVKEKQARQKVAALAAWKKQEEEREQKENNLLPGAARVTTIGTQTARQAAVSVAHAVARER